MHLAELNVGRLVAPTDDPQVADFMNNHAAATGDLNETLLGWLPQPDGRNRDGGHHRRAKLVYVYGHRGGDCAAMGLCLGFHVGGHGADPDAGISAQGQGRHQPNTRQTQAMRFPAGREFALGTKGLQALVHTA